MLLCVSLVTSLTSCFTLIKKGQQSGCVGSSLESVSVLFEKDRTRDYLAMETWFVWRSLSPALSLGGRAGRGGV